MVDTVGSAYLFTAGQYGLYNEWLQQSTAELVILQTLHTLILVIVYNTSKLLVSVLMRVYSVMSAVTTALFLECVNIIYLKLLVKNNVYIITIIHKTVISNAARNIQL